jgi:hypothetical protein
MLDHIISLDREIPRIPILYATEEGFFKDDQIVLSLLMEDLSQAPDDLDVHEVYSMEKKDKSDFLLCLIALGTGWDQERSMARESLIVPDLPACENGSRGIDVFLPKTLLGLGEIIPPPDGYPHRNSTLSTPGTFTNCHWDLHGIAQIIVQVFGKKLWYTWPGTVDNLKIFAPYYHMPSQEVQFNIPRALKELSGLEIVYLDQPGQLFYLKPYTIHTCIGITNSGHIGHTYVSYPDFPAWKEAHMMVESCWKEMVTTRPNDLQLREKCIEETKTGLRAFSYWVKLFSSIPEHPFHPAFKKELESVEDSMSEYIEYYKQSKPGVVTGGKRKRA